MPETRDKLKKHCRVFYGLEMVTDTMNLSFTIYIVSSSLCPASFTEVYSQALTC